MQCDEFKEALINAAHPSDQTPEELDAHEKECEPCQIFKKEAHALDALLSLDQHTPPRPGFNTRFHARLEELKAEESSPGLLDLLKAARFWLAGAAACAAALTLFFQMPPAPSDPLLDPDISLAMELDMLEDLEVLAHLDEIEDFDVITQLKLDELEGFDSDATEEVRFQ